MELLWLHGVGQRVFKDGQNNRRFAPRGGDESLALLGRALCSKREEVSIVVVHPRRNGRDNPREEVVLAALSGNHECFEHDALHLDWGCVRTEDDQYAVLADLGSETPPFWFVAAAANDKREYRHAGKQALCNRGRCH